MKYLPEGKAVLTGSPIRRDILTGSRLAALDFCHFTADKPVLLIIGGSIGSVFINNAVRHSLDRLLEKFQIIHLCGKGNLDPTLADRQGYAQYEYISDNLADLFAAADLVISRAGANSICELLALRKPNILIPLSARASRGDQILNARSFERQGFSYVIEEETLTPEVLFNAIQTVNENRASYIQAMEQSGQKDAVAAIMKLIEEIA